MRKKVSRAYHRYLSHRELLKSERARLRQLDNEIDGVEGAQQLIHSLSEELQRRLHVRIAEVVSRCLRTVFGDDAYEFRIVFETKRSNVEARLVFVRDGLEVDPLSASGGGVVDIAAFALRLACILSSRPALRRLIVLDEPFRHLSVDLRPIAAELMRALAEETGTQFIVVSHFREVEVGRVIRIGESSKKSRPRTD